MRPFRHVGVLAAAGLAVVVAIAADRAPASAQDGETRKRIAALEAGQKAILKELQEIKALLQARPAQAPPQAAPEPQNIVLSMEGAATKGRPDAKLTVVEFSDFQCPFCGRYVRETYQQLEREYVNTGKVRYVFRHFPLERIHPQAFKAGEAAECARLQGKFWEMHAWLFAHQQALGETELPKYAQTVGLDVSAFQRCLGGQATAKIRQDMDEGARAGVSGTPMFFVGTVKKDGKLHVQRRLSGAQPYAAFKTALDALLALPEASK